MLSPFTGAYPCNPNLSVGQAIQQQIPNWQVLFEPTSYGACCECGSVYGPAAYFVDLLQFLRNSGMNAAGYTPLDVLIGATSGSTTIPGRRPDLLYIKLDCQNSNTPLPYVDLVNEIVESYVALGGKLDSSTAHNTPADATTDFRIGESHLRPGVVTGGEDHTRLATRPESSPESRTKSPSSGKTCPRVKPLQVLCSTLPVLKRRVRRRQGLKR